MIRITEEMRERWRDPSWVRLWRLKKIIEKCRPTHKSPRWITSCWNEIMENLHDQNRSILSIQGIENHNITKHLRIAWMSVPDTEFSPLRRGAGLILSLTEPNDLTSKIRVLAVRYKGPWEIERESLWLLETHPEIRFLRSNNSAINWGQRFEDIIGDAFAGRSENEGQRSSDARGSSIAEEIFNYFYDMRLSTNSDQHWLNHARKDMGFWKLLVELIELGRSLGQSEILRDPDVEVDLERGDRMNRVKVKRTVDKLPSWERKAVELLFANKSIYRRDLMSALEKEGLATPLPDDKWRLKGRPRTLSFSGFQSRVSLLVRDYL